VLLKRADKEKRTSVHKSKDDRRVSTISMEREVHNSDEANKNKFF